MNLKLIVFLLLTSAICPLPSALADDQLDDLFEGLPAAKKAEKPAANADDLLGGEDIELGGAKDPFARIATKMQRSRDALTSGSSGEPTQELQKEILLDLDALLKNMEKKCQGGNCKKPGSSSSASASSKAGSKSNSKPSDSTNRVGEAGKTESEESASAADRIKEVWGHLPPKVREAMQNASLEEFLPKYDKLIEEFYRRLAEQPARGS